MPYFWLHSLLPAVTECHEATAVEVIWLVLQVEINGINGLFIGDVALSTQILFEIREEVEVRRG